MRGHTLKLCLTPAGSNPNKSRRIGLDYLDAENRETKGRYRAKRYAHEMRKRNCSDSSNSTEEQLLIPNGSLPVESEKEKMRAEIHSEHQIKDAHSKT